MQVGIRDWDVIRIEHRVVFVEKSRLNDRDGLEDEGKDLSSFLPNTPFRSANPSSSLQNPSLSSQNASLP
jgi:hypothetical protein